jgi:hypothetical protein
MYLSSQICALYIFSASQRISPIWDQWSPSVMQIIRIVLGFGLPLVSVVQKFILYIYCL